MWQRVSWPYGWACIARWNSPELVAEFASRKRSGGDHAWAAVAISKEEGNRLSPGELANPSAATGSPARCQVLSGPRPGAQVMVQFEMGFVTASGAPLRCCSATLMVNGKPCRMKGPFIARRQSLKSIEPKRVGLWSNHLTGGEPSTFNKSNANNIPHRGSERLASESHSRRPQTGPCSCHQEAIRSRF